MLMSEGLLLDSEMTCKRLVAADDADFVVFEIDNLVGISYDRSRVRGDESLAFAHADYQWRAFACHNHRVGIFLLDNCDGIRAFDLKERFAHGFKECA